VTLVTAFGGNSAYSRVMNASSTYGGSATGSTNRKPGEEPAGFIGPKHGRVMVYRDDGIPQPLKTGDPVYVGDVLESETSGTVDVTFTGMTTLSVDGNGRLVVTRTRKADPEHPAPPHATGIDITG
jgi:hypothetical protein